MRIGIYAPNMATPAPSGVERYVNGLVEALGRRDDDHDYVLMTDREELPDSREAEHLVAFLEKSERGFCRIR